MKTLLIMLLCSLSSTVFAGSYADFLDRNESQPKFDLYLNVNGASHHINTSREFNENNMGFGLILEKDNKTSVSYGTVGYYENSFNKTSVYLGYGYKEPLVNYGAFSVQAGFLGGVVIGGYEETSGNTFIPMGLLTLTAGIKEIKATLSYAPKSYKDTPAVIMFNMQVEL